MNENQPNSISRIILFVAVAGLILILTQKFSTPAPTPATVTDSTSIAAPAVKADPLPTIQPADSTRIRNNPGVEAAIAAFPAIPVETVTVADSVTRYVFTNRGATATSIELLKHPDLGPSDGVVKLLRDNEAVVQYHLVTGGDTISLSDLTFSSTVDRNGAGTPTQIHYRSTIPGLNVQVMIDYAIVPDSHLVRLNGRLEGLTGKSFLIAEFPSGIRSGEADSLEDQRHFAIAYRRMHGDVQGIPFSKLDPREKHNSTTAVAWMALKSKYFIIALLKAEGDSGFAQAQIIGGPRVSREATHIAAYAIDDVSDGSFGFDIYTGPQEFNRLVALGRDFQNSNPYGGWLQGVVQPFAVVVMKALLWLKHSTNLSYGWVLIIFGVIVRLLLWPLNQKAMRTSMRMQRLQPELTEVQAKYKSNPQKLQEEIMRVYRDHGMTPFSPLAGCLPMLIPMPVFFALFFVFQNTIEFRGVPFLWLPDISLKDPFYIVPVFMGVSMFVMSWMGSRSAPQNPQTKMMLYMLPVMMTVLFLNFASGLNLYYAVQNVAALPQQWLIARERKQGDAVKGGGTAVKKKKEKG